MFSTTIKRIMSAFDLNIWFWFDLHHEAKTCFCTQQLLNKTSVSSANGKKHLNDMLAFHRQSLKSQPPTAKHNNNLKWMFCSALLFLSQQSRTFRWGPFERNCFIIWIVVELSKHHRIYTSNWRDEATKKEQATTQKCAICVGMR